MLCYVFGLPSVWLANMNLYRFMRSFLFLFAPETAHYMIMRMLRLLNKIGLLKFFCSKPIESPVEVFGIQFKNRIGLAAGFDKNAEYIDEWFALGVGFVEVGTVTPKAQPGNPKPRLFRLTRAAALINRMGFNNDGIDALIKNLNRRKSQGIIGINIGKNIDTSIEKAIDDYRYCLERIYPFADYVVVNISSPNTPNLRDLQHERHLDELLRVLVEDRDHLAHHHGAKKPLLVKLSPDIDHYDLTSTINTIKKHQIDGIVACNTSLSRDGVGGLQYADKRGGLSGAPITQKCHEVLREISKLAGDDMPIIGVGGIMNAEDAKERLVAGASLLQLYTGLVYVGPRLIREILS